MPLTIVPYSDEHIPAVLEFNERGKAHRAPFSISKTPVASWLPKIAGKPIFREFYVALDGGAVRGGFTLRRQDFWIRGERCAVANYQGPISEGIWDRRFMMAGVQMLRAAMRDQPLLYALGMGGVEQPLPKLLQSAGWQMAPVPFFFKVLRGSRFLRHIRPLRKQQSRARLMDIAAVTGLGALLIRGVHWWKSSGRLAAGTAETAETSFGSWADEIWGEARNRIGFTAVRDAAAQNAIFGDGNDKNIILRCIRNDQTIGWAVVRSTAMRDDKYFGDMRVGTLVDCLALPGEEFDVVALATSHLRRLGSDLVVTNQSHSLWTAALRQNGYLSGPSNFIFAVSPALAEKLGPLDAVVADVHINRADGDGPIHL